MDPFEKLVREMRNAQRAIFLKASPENIKRVKILEHGVDKMLATKQNHPKETFFEWENPVRY